MTEWRDRTSNFDFPYEVDRTSRIEIYIVEMAYNSGGANPIGVKTGPRPEDAYVPPVNKETLDSIESKKDQAQAKGETKREGVVGIIINQFRLMKGHQGSNSDERLAWEAAADHKEADKLQK
jgi:hypothetical protein